MKKFLIFVALAISGCARFTTVQMDDSFKMKPRSGSTNENIEVRKITTKATAYTFFASKSGLANWKAEQTDKKQSAEVGELNQASQVIDTNAVEALRSIQEILEKVYLK